MEAKLQKKSILLLFFHAETAEIAEIKVFPAVSTISAWRRFLDKLEMTS